MAIVADETWLRPGQAAARLGVGLKQLRRLRDRGLLTRRVLPGVSVRYLASDVERLCRDSVIPATQWPPTARREGQDR
jgi:hypothetical protein